MNKNLFGTVVLDRHTVDDDLWLCEPFSRGQAWLDLVFLANDEPRTLMVRGVPVRLEKGQVGRSVVSLAERWQWSREKTRTFLEDLRDRRKISYRMDNVATVIAVLDYGVLNREKEGSPTADSTAEQTPEPTANQTADSTAEPMAEPTQNIGIGEQGNKNKGTGEGPPPRRIEIPDDEEIEKFCSEFGDQSRGIFGIPEGWWRGWVAARLAARGWPADWRRALRNAFLGDWVARHPKALANVAKNGAAGNHAGPLRERGEILQELEFEKDAGRRVELEAELKRLSAN